MRGCARMRSSLSAQTSTVGARTRMALSGLQGTHQVALQLLAAPV